MGKKAESFEVLPYSVDAVWDALVRALDGSKFKVVSSDAAARTVELKTGVSLRSWGEKLRVELAPEGEGTKLSVRSAAKLGTTLFDYGKNAENVRSIVELVRGRLS